MISAFLRKRRSFSDGARNSPPHRIVESFNTVCKSRFLTDRSVPSDRNDSLAGIPKICKTDSASSINGGKTVPQGPRSLATPVADRIRRLLSLFPTKDRILPHSTVGRPFFQKARRVFGEHYHTNHRHNIAAAVRTPVQRGIFRPKGFSQTEAG